MTVKRPLMTARQRRLGLRPDLRAVCFVLLLVGCEGGPKTGHERYVPAPEKAQATIGTVLESWQRGEPVGEIKGASAPKVFVVDSFRREGQQLERFDILGEVTGHTLRTYLVKLTLANPAAEEKVRFAVLGIDPLWVYRHEDLELLAHWEHKMPESAAKQSAAEPAKTREAQP